MNNYEKYMSEMTMDKFLDIMALNCDVCPASPCAYDDQDVVSGAECEVELAEWCLKGGA